MKICAAQTRPVKGDVPGNIARHKKIIALAVSCGADSIVFPELSLTGYEPRLAKELATDRDDERFTVFQEISDIDHITVCVGMPVKSNTGILIDMIIFQPHTAKQTYAKQYLHADEFPYFVQGDQQVILAINDHHIAPAICYESLLPEHAAKAFTAGADMYMASVAKSATGIKKAQAHFPVIAEKYSMTVLLSNCAGPCDNFECAGNTSIWNNKGELAGQLNDRDEGILIFDTTTLEVIEKNTIT